MIEEPVMVDTPLLLSCQRCGGEMVSRRSVYPNAIVCPPPGVTILCRVCGWRMETRQTAGRRSFTQERVHRAGAPLREIVEIDRGYDGEGMRFVLACGHEVRLQRRAYRFDQQRLRCVACREEEEGA